MTMLRYLLFLAALVLAACATDEQVASLQAKQKAAQAAVDLACAGVTVVLTPDVTKASAQAQADCALATALAAEVTAALAAYAPAPASAASQ